MNKYPKIYSPYERFTEGPQRNKLDTSRWTSPGLALLADAPWNWTEKIDGTNIRVGWDGHTVAFGGRTDNAQIPATLYLKLTEMFPEELLEQTFRDTPVTLFGEGYGPKIQKGGGLYRADQSFILFDVQVGQVWLRPEQVNQIAADMGLSVVPQLPSHNLWDAMTVVNEGFYSFFGGDTPFFAEGIVGRAPEGLLDRRGNRIMVKLKHIDFYHQ